MPNGNSLTDMVILRVFQYFRRFAFPPHFPCFQFLASGQPAHIHVLTPFILDSPTVQIRPCVRHRRRQSSNPIIEIPCLTTVGKAGIYSLLGPQLAARAQQLLQQCEDPKKCSLLRGSCVPVGGWWISSLTVYTEYKAGGYP